jgi:hypothetical protein
MRMKRLWFLGFLFLTLSGSLVWLYQQRPQAAKTAQGPDTKMSIQVIATRFPNAIKEFREIPVHVENFGTKHQILGSTVSLPNEAVVYTSGDYVQITTPDWTIQLWENVPVASQSLTSWSDWWKAIKLPNTTVDQDGLLSSGSEGNILQSIARRVSFLGEGGTGFFWKDDSCAGVLCRKNDGSFNGWYWKSLGDEGKHFKGSAKDLGKFDHFGRILIGLSKSK